MRRAPIATVAISVTALLAAACGVPTTGRAADETGRGSVTSATAAPAVRTATPTAGRPNIVFVLMDDFSMDLLPTMRSARVMARRGASYENSFVVDSLCCVSRSATFTGQYPHQTGVLTNNSNLPNRHGPLGGWRGFATYGNQARTFAVGLQESGYVTGFVGKYLNGYEVRARDQQLPPVPPGWSEFRAIFGTAYDGWDFQGTRTTDKGTTVVRSWPAPPAGATRKQKDRAYAGTVIDSLAMKFLRERRGDPRPYFLEVAPYAPHGRVDDDPAYADESLFPAAFRDQPGGSKKRGDCGLVACRGLTTRDLPGFRDRGSAQWNRRPHTLTRSQAQTNLRDRARMAQSVDRMVLRILRQVDDNTYVVLTSDNGFHLGQMGLLRGKGTAYDTDTRVPLLVVGPPGRAGLARHDGQQHRPGTDLRGARRRQHAALPVGALARPDPGRSCGRRVGLRVLRAHLLDEPPRRRPGPRLHRRWVERHPVVRRRRSRTALLVRNDLDRRWGRHRYAYGPTTTATSPGSEPTSTPTRTTPPAHDPDGQASTRGTPARDYVAVRLCPTRVAR